MQLGSIERVSKQKNKCVLGLLSAEQVHGHDDKPRDAEETQHKWKAK